MKGKRKVALFLSLLIFWLAVPFGSASVQAAEAKEETTLIVHLADQSKQWSLWVWPENGDGAVYEFTGEDDFGKVAKVTIPGVHQKLGFIVRTETWEKFGGDRMVDTSSGLAEVWVTGAETTETEPPNPNLRNAHDQLSVTFHYKRMDGNYEGWNLWAWPLDGDGQEVAFTEEDSFGKVANITMSGTDLRAMGYIIKRTVDGNAWAEKDGNKDQFITTFDENGHADVWVVSGDPTTYYNPFFAASEAKITSSSLTDFNEITVKVNKPLGDVTASMVSLTPGEVTKVEKVDDLTLIVTTKDEVDFRSTTEMSVEGYGSSIVTMGSLLRSNAFDERYATDAPLGALYGKDYTTLRVWAPTASKVEAVLYESYQPDAAIQDVLPMEMAKDGTWSIRLKGDQHNTAYTYRVSFPDGTVNDSQDPYAKAVVANGDRSVIVDLSRTNPESFKRMPSFSANVDAVIYEVHVRDFSIDKSSGIENKGKFIGMIEKGTKNPQGDTTGLDYIKTLGITHVQILPMFDYASVDELSSKAQFNWGYDPKNYNAPEGSYATDAITPTVRIKEMKDMIQGMHQAGLRVIMDVVYNHVYSAGSHAFQKIVPGYYFRFDSKGNYTNATGVGNDTASERAMMRRFIVDSTTYWAEEYNLDGFRFDLMGIHDVETMNQVREALNKIDPGIVTLGEGWNMGTHPEEVRATQKNANKLPDIAFFNDSFRDAVKGSVFNASEGGFVQGAKGKEEILAINVKGAQDLPDDIATYQDPEQVIQYAEAHDNLTLWDKLVASVSDGSSLERRLNLATSIVALSQGVPFYQAGQEFLREKDGNENSYNAPDSVNAIDWNRRSEEEDSVNYFKGLLALRKSNELFRLKTYDAIDANMDILKAEDHVVAYELGDEYVVIFNANDSAIKFPLEKGKYQVVGQNNVIHMKKGNKNKKAELHLKKGGVINKKGTVSVSPFSTTVLKKAN